MMPRLCAGSWDAATLFLQWEVPILDKAVAAFTWTMCSAQGMSPPCLSAGALAGASTTVRTVKTQAFSAQVLLFFLHQSCHAFIDCPHIA